ARARGGRRPPTPGESARARRVHRRHGGGRARRLPRSRPRPPRALPRARGSGTRPPRCSRRPAARGTRRRSRSGHVPGSDPERARASCRATPRSRVPRFARAASAGTRGSAHRRSRGSGAAWARSYPFHMEAPHRTSGRASPAKLPAPVSQRLAQLPNALTLARLALIPVFVVLMVRAGHRPSWPAGVAFGIAGITDQVDGFLARRWHVESRFGKLADPLADRLMIDAAVILL